MPLALGTPILLPFGLHPQGLKAGSNQIEVAVPP